MHGFATFVVVDDTALNYCMVVTMGVAVSIVCWSSSGVAHSVALAKKTNSDRTEEVAVAVGGKNCFDSYFCPLVDDIVVWMAAALVLLDVAAVGGGRSENQRCFAVAHSLELRDVQVSGQHFDVVAGIAGDIVVRDVSSSVGTLVAVHNLELQTDVVAYSMVKTAVDELSAAELSFGIGRLFEKILSFEVLVRREPKDAFAKIERFGDSRNYVVDIHGID